jgi:CRISPR-associated protein Cas2
MEVINKMIVLITYDVNTEDAAGRSRLRKIAKQCVNCGQRVQNSVFECDLDPSQYRLMKHKLETLMDKSKDSLRIYKLGNNYKSKIEHLGARPSYDPEGVIII